jgi:hypothetical protein
MTAQSLISGSQQKSAPANITLLTAREAARILKVSVSWLAKARMRGETRRLGFRG